MRVLRPVIAGLVLLGCLGSGSFCVAEKWPGVDEAVVNRIAREHGRPERPPLIPAPEGDLQLLLFLLAGVAGGFVAGYYWRVLLEGKTRPAKTIDHEGHE